MTPELTALIAIYDLVLHHGTSLDVQAFQYLAAEMGYTLEEVRDARPEG